MSEMAGVLPAAGAERERRTARLVLALLLVRLAAGIGLIPGFAPLAARAVVYYAYIILTYLVTAWLVWHERGRLGEYRVGRLALILFVAGVPYHLLGRAAGFIVDNWFPTLLLLPITIWLLARLLRAKDVRAADPPGLGRWLGIGVLVGLAAGVLVGLLFRFGQGGPGHSDPWYVLALLPTLQLVNAASQEEPLFRGFLWGWLEQRGWPGRRIWLAQAGLFWLGHIYYF